MLQEESLSWGFEIESMSHMLFYVAVWMLLFGTFKHTVPCCWWLDAMAHMAPWVIPSLARSDMMISDSYRRCDEIKKNKCVKLHTFCNTRFLSTNSWVFFFWKSCNRVLLLHCSPMFQNTKAATAISLLTTTEAHILTKAAKDCWICFPGTSHSDVVHAHTTFASIKYIFQLLTWQRKNLGHIASSTKNTDCW
jgi:hypothetical protein